MNLNEFFNGNKLYGDDFSLEEIKKWYYEEEEAYADLGAKNVSTYNYSYHELNKKYGYKFLKKDKYEKALGFGSAYGDELIPIIDKIDKVFIIDSSDQLSSKNIKGKSIDYRKASSSGQIDLPNDCIDLITCFGVLHHIPNVSFVFTEFVRILKNGGYLLIREPIVSMGDWRNKRVGLSKNERGIPKQIFMDLIANNNLKIVNYEFCFFPITDKLARILGIPKMNSSLMLLIDNIFSKLFRWNYHYHSKNILQKFQPQAIYFVLQKNEK